MSNKLIVIIISIFIIDSTAGAVLKHYVKRQIDLTLLAEHDEKKDETELALEAIANLWSSSDGKTQIEGSTKVVHRSNSFQNGNIHYSGRLHLHHDYIPTINLKENNCV